jgi:VCBS repeat-containing protein
MPSGPITFDLTGSVPSNYSMAFVQSGLSLTVSSALYRGGPSGDQAVYEFSTPTLSMNGDGIGALNTYNDLGMGFDGDGKYEMATLSFGQTVKITSVTLVPMGTRYNLTGANTQFVMFGQGLVVDPLSRQTIDATDFTNETALYGNFVGIAAYSRYDQFRVASITVETVDLVSAADAYSVKSGDAPTVLDVLSNDVDGRQISGLDVAGVLGTVTLAADGRTVTYDAGMAFDNLGLGQVATETFTYTVLGWDGTSETQTVTVTVTGGANEVTGTSAANSLSGTAKRDIMRGLAGNDTLSGLDGNDDIDGGLDNDRLYGNAGDDLVNGGDGDDYVYGDAGNDTVVGGAGNDRLFGGDGNDSLDGSIGTDRLYGEAGNDILTGSNLVNTLDGGVGVDTMTGGAGSDKYYVDDAADQVIELASEGTDTVYTTVDFTLASNVENMIVTGLNAVDGTGNTLGNRLTGNAANNLLTGLAGNDRLDGGLGDDDLLGGLGRDILTGGGGADEFQFAEFGSANYDTVVDFNGLEDTIQLSAATFGLAVGALQEAAFVVGTAATDAAHRIVYDQANGDIFYDADGNGTGARQLIASLVNGTVLGYDDIFVF